MAEQEYTPQQALQTLLSRLRERAPEVTDEIQAAVDSGKDSWEPEPTRGLRVSGRRV